MSADPQTPFRAADMFADLVAAGVIAEDEAMAALADAARRAAPARDGQGMRMRLAHRLRDAADERRRVRWFADGRLARAVNALLDGWAPPAAIERAAAEAAGDAFAPHELKARLARLVRARLS